MPRPPADERGESATEMVLAVPVLMLLVFLVIQFGLWYHANHVAEAAAQEGVRAARVVDGSAAAGQARAAEFMGEAAPSLVRGTVVVATRTDEQAAVEVTGELQSIVPGLRLPVRAEARSPVERFRGADE
jgi:Flp pilus assembly protein TadG